MQRNSICADRDMQLTQTVACQHERPASAVRQLAAAHKPTFLRTSSASLRCLRTSSTSYSTKPRFTAICQSGSRCGYTARCDVAVGSVCPAAWDVPVWLLLADGCVCGEVRTQQQLVQESQTVQVITDGSCAVQNAFVGKPDRKQSRSRKHRKVRNVYVGKAEPAERTQPHAISYSERLAMWSHLRPALQQPTLQSFQTPEKSKVAIRSRDSTHMP